MNGALDCLATIRGGGGAKNSDLVTIKWLGFYEGVTWACFARWFFTLMTANGPLIRMNAACSARGFSHVH